MGCHLPTSALYKRRNNKKVHKRRNNKKVSKAKGGEAARAEQVNLVAILLIIALLLLADTKHSR